MPELWRVTPAVAARSAGSSVDAAQPDGCDCRRGQGRCKNDLVVGSVLRSTAWRLQVTTAMARVTSLTTENVSRVHSPSSTRSLESLQTDRQLHYRHQLGHDKELPCRAVSRCMLLAETCFVFTSVFCLLDSCIHDSSDKRSFLVSELGVYCSSVSCCCCCCSYVSCVSGDVMCYQFTFRMNCFSFCILHNISFLTDRNIRGSLTHGCAHFLMWIL